MPTPKCLVPTTSWPSTVRKDAGKTGFPGARTGGQSSDLVSRPAGRMNCGSFRMRKERQAMSDRTGPCTAPLRSARSTITIPIAGRSFSMPAAGLSVTIRSSGGGATWRRRPFHRPLSLSEVNLDQPATHSLAVPCRDPQPPGPVAAWFCNGSGCTGCQRLDQAGKGRHRGPALGCPGRLFARAETLPGPRRPDHLCRCQKAPFLRPAGSRPEGRALGELVPQGQGLGGEVRALSTTRLEE